MAQSNETIEVLYALTDKKGTYSKFAGTSICSMFVNTEERVRVHIFHDGSIEGQNKENFLKLASDFGQEILFYNVRQLLPEVWKEAEKIMVKAIKDERYTEAALYRLLAPQLLSENVGRIIYLDADTIVHMDVSSLWREPIGINGMSAVFENDLLEHYGRVGSSKNSETQKLIAYWQTLGVDIKDGFNSGVLLMDLQLIRPRGDLLLKGLEVALGCESESNFYDQNILNFYFAQEAGHLPWYYNILQHWDRQMGKMEEVKGIYHYMGRSLGMNEQDIRDTLFYDYFLRAPWADGRFLCHFHRELKELHTFKANQNQEKMQRLLSALLMKRPVIAASDTYMPKISALLGKSASAPTLSPKGLFCKLGEDSHLKLDLPFDVDSHFYLFFVEDYVKLKVLLERGGLPETEYYMDGRFMLENDFLEKNINLSRVFETL